MRKMGLKLKSLLFYSSHVFTQKQSVPLTCFLFWYFAAPSSPNPADPDGWPMMVDRSPPLSRGFSAAPTRDGSALALSLLNVRHSDPTSIHLQGTKGDGSLINS